MIFPPIRTDLFSIFILLGTVQGFFLSYFFIASGRSNKFSNFFLGALLFSLSVVTGDVWLGYTNYMFYTLFLVDSTEPINLMLAPLTYLYIKTGIEKRFSKWDLVHFLPAFIYLVYMCLVIYPQDIEFKYNYHVGAYHPELSKIPARVYGQEWMFFLKRRIGEFTFLSLLCYDIICFRFLAREFRKINLSFFTTQKSNLSWYRNFIIELLLLIVVYVIVRSSFSHDLGDHITAAFISLIVYTTSATVFSRSLFFQEDHVKAIKKYEKSSLTTELQKSTILKLDDLMKDEKPFLNAGFSLPALAKSLGISTHHLSQILNEELGQTFFDFLASYRIAEAQKLLMSGEHNYIKIEEIAQMVGYNSKSAFNTAFRKITGATPSEFKRQRLK